MEILGFDTAIIGAGISGLSARKRLKDHRLNTITLEKSRGCGGRMATRRGEQWIADLGAQFTAASDARWQAVVYSQAEELIRLQVQEDAKFPRYAHQRGMSAFARALLSQGGPPDDIRFQSKVVRLFPDAAQRFWNLVLENDETISAASVLLSAPVPQALELLKCSGLELSEKSRVQVADLNYHPCIAVIAELDRALPLGLPILWKNPSFRFSGVFDQKRKGLTGERNQIVLHASKEASQELWKLEDSVALQTVLKDFRDLLKTHQSPAEVLSATLHRWRYCEPLKAHPEPFLKLTLERPTGSHPQIYLIGDAFGRSSVEGAFLSGASAAESLLNGAHPIESRSS